MKSKRKTPYPTPEAQTRTVPMAGNGSTATPSAPSPTSATPATTAASVQAAPKVSRKKRVSSGPSMTQVLSRHPKVSGFDEFDLRGVRDDRELSVLTDYEYAREGIRWCLDELVLEGKKDEANGILKLMASAPVLASLPKGKVDADDLDHLSDMLLTWRNCAPSASLPPPAMGMIKRFRKYMSEKHHFGPVKIFRLRDKTFAKNRLGDRFSRTFIVQVLKHPKRKARANDVVEALRHVLIADGACMDERTGRPKAEALALLYVRVCKGNKEPKAHLYFAQCLRPDETGVTELGKELYAVATSGKMKSPSKSAWSEGLKRAQKRIRRLAKLFLRLVEEGHLIALKTTAQS